MTKIIPYRISLTRKWSRIIINSSKYSSPNASKMKNKGTNIRRMDSITPVNLCDIDMTDVNCGL